MLSRSLNLLRRTSTWAQRRYLFTIKELMEARVHLGHKEGSLNQHMRPYIFGKRLGVLVIDLDQTAKALKQALNVTTEIARRKGVILFVHNSRQNGYVVEETARECGEYAHCRRWTDAVFSDATKTFGAVTRLPDLVIVLSQPHNAVKMAAKLLIPTIGICDTNIDPTLITYPIPGNDDSPESIELYCRLFKDAILKGKNDLITDSSSSGDGDDVDDGSPAEEEETAIDLEQPPATVASARE